jgi:serine/threonine protein kinase
VLGDESVALIRADELRLVRRVGVGGFGEVFEGSWCGTTVAVKKMLAFALNDEAMLVKDFVRELQMLSRLRHPNILLLVGFCVDQGSQAIVSEYCSRGSVWNALHGSDATRAEFTAERRRAVAQQVAAAMAYLHGAAILHRDLKWDSVSVGLLFLTPY